tara:strand:- start:1498 stop:2670 length:1173 start_codon:yes stop_codon:yes gene_type:complete
MGSPNPEILRWARETAGFSLEEAARRLNMSSKSAIETLVAYEEGQKAPSRPRLKAMAKQYHRSYLTFFLHRPPERADLGEDFRTLPGADPQKNSGTLDALVRDIYVRQSLVKEALIETEEAEEIGLVGAGSLRIPVPEACRAIAEFFNIDVDVFRAQNSSHDAFAYLRSQVESRNIYVLLIGDLGTHHSQVSPDVFRGFALSDAIAPFIVVNNYDSKAAWSFTLLHELVHIWLGKTGISNQSHEHVIEKYCNDVASHFLVADEEIEMLRPRKGDDVEDILTSVSAFTRDNNVSGSLVVYRMFRSGLINEPTWRQLKEEFARLWRESKLRERENRKGKDSSGSYYNTQKHKVGRGLIGVVKRSIGEGVLTETKASKVLGVSSGSVTEMLGA